MCSDCYEEYLKEKEPFCPLCKKSLFDMKSVWQRIDSLIQHDLMPPEFSKVTVDILCNDCNKQSMAVKYHFQYNKCSHCGSYNTNILQINRNEENREELSENEENTEELSENEENTEELSENEENTEELSENINH